METIKKDTYHPLVSILMAVYNESAQNLKESTHSILNQTYKNIEFIIIEDYGSDENREYLKILEKDDRVKVIYNTKNLGLTRSLNIGAKEASGEYIARLDSDDIATPDRIQKQFTKFNENNNLVLCGGQGNEISDGKAIDWNIHYVQENNKLRKALLSYNPFIHSTLFFKKSVFEKINGYNEFYRYSQDYDFVIRMAKHGEILNLKEKLVTRHFSKNQISLKRQRQQMIYSILIRFKAQFVLGPSLKGFISIIKSFIGLFIPLKLKLKLKRIDINV